MAWMSAQRWSFNDPFSRGESEGDKSGEYGATDWLYSYLMYGQNILWWIISYAAGEWSCRRNHFPVDHDSGRRRRIMSRKRCGRLWWIFWFTVWHRTGQIFVGLCVINPVSELSGHRLYFLTQDHRQLLIICLSRVSDIWRLL